MPTEAEIQIITELMKLNKTLEHLTKEHVQHFQEWRRKNLKLGGVE